MPADYDRMEEVKYDDSVFLAEHADKEEAGNKEDDMAVM